MGNICYEETILIENPKVHSKLSESINHQLNRITFKENIKKIEKEQNLEILKSYQIIKLIGKGMYSKVFLALDASSNKVALKIIPKEVFQNMEDLKNILIEKELLKVLDNEHILKMYRSLQTDSKIIFFLEYASKGNLLNLINAKSQLKIEEIRIIAAQILEGLMYMHSKRIIYGDLKAENVLMTSSGIIKLCDFNFSGTTSLLGTSLQGTVNYLSPELLSGYPKTFKSDIWAFGILLHFKEFIVQNYFLTSLINNSTKKNTIKKRQKISDFF